MYKAVDLYDTGELTSHTSTQWMHVTGDTDMGQYVYGQSGNMVIHISVGYTARKHKLV